MWVVVHTVSGLALGQAMSVGLGLPWWTIPLPALATHLVLDIAPHWDYYSQPNRVRLAAMDTAVAVLVTVLVWQFLDLSAAVLLAGAMAALPDTDALDIVFPRLRRFRWFPTHRPGFPHGQVGPRAGAVWQGGTVAVSLAVLLLL